MIPAYFLIESNFQNYVDQTDLVNKLEQRGYMLSNTEVTSLYKLDILSGNQDE